MLKEIIYKIMKLIRNDNGWDQNYFTPRFPDKCINSLSGKPVIYRSSWEKRFFNYCDMNANVVKWGSEIISIPYIHQLDNKKHTYYPDIYCEIKNKEGVVEKFIIEIKPKNQLDKPRLPKTKTKKALKNFNYSMTQYIKNQDKWKYAKMYCETRNYKFKIMTEENLF
jgi:hypothetical protein